MTFFDEMYKIVDKVNEYNAVAKDYHYLAAKQKVEDYRKEIVHLYCKTRVKYLDIAADKRKEIRDTASLCKQLKEEYYNLKKPLKAIRKLVENSVGLAKIRFQEFLPKFERTYKKAKQDYEETNATYIKLHDDYTNFRQSLDKSVDAEYAKVKQEYIDSQEKDITEAKQIISKFDAKLSFLGDKIENDVNEMLKQYKVGNDEMVSYLADVTGSKWSVKKVVSENVNKNAYGVVLVKNSDQSDIMLKNISDYAKKNANVLLTATCGTLYGSGNEALDKIYLDKYNKQAENYNWVKDWFICRGIYVKGNIDDVLRLESLEPSQRKLIISAVEKSPKIRPTSTSIM